MSPFVDDEERTRVYLPPPETTSRGQPPYAPKLRLMHVPADEATRRSVGEEGISAGRRSYPASFLGSADECRGQ